MQIIIRKSKENRTKVLLIVFLEKQKTRFLHRRSFLHPSNRTQPRFLFSREFPLRIYIYIYLSLAMQRDLCVSRASLPVLGVHLCDRFAMMYDSRVSLSTRASGSFPSSFPFWWNKHLFPVSAVLYVFEMISALS